MGLFPSFFSGGFECATHRRADGRRVDPLAGSGHAARPAEDYALLAAHGLRTARDGVRWPHAEPTPGRYRFAQAATRAAAARRAGVTVIWDLCHYGVPDGLDVFSPAFVDRFAAYARAAARMLADETDGPLFVCPINELSFWAWAGGDRGFMTPHARDRGFELKVNGVRALLAAIEAIWGEAPGARIVYAEPLCHVAAPPERPDLRAEAWGVREAQFQVFDLVCGRLWPGAGGHPKYLDVLGLNVYPRNQWLHLGAGQSGQVLPPGHPLHVPLRTLLAEVHARYARPLFLAETGDEGAAAVPWLRYVGTEARAARAAGLPLEGVCLYPVLDYPGWDDDRWCHCGLFGGEGTLDGPRRLNPTLAAELFRQQALERGPQPAPVGTVPTGSGLPLNAGRTPALMD